MQAAADIESRALLALIVISLSLSIFESSNINVRTVVENYTCLTHTSVMKYRENLTEHFGVSFD